MRGIKDFVFETCFDDLDDRFLNIFYNKISPNCIKLSSFFEDKEVSTGYMLKVNYQNKTGFYLYGLATLPEYRKQGRMTKILKEAEKIATDAGADFLFLATDNCKAEKLYRDNGYVKQDFLKSSSSADKNSVSFVSISVEEYVDLTENQIKLKLNCRKDLLVSIESTIKCYKNNDGVFMADDSLVLDYYPKTDCFKQAILRFNPNYSFFVDTYSVMVRFLKDSFKIELKDFILY